MTPADSWHDALRRANTLDPDRIAAAINTCADSGLRAASYDRSGGRTTFVPCEDPSRCHDGPLGHSHAVVADPTGNAAMATPRYDFSGDLRRLQIASQRFVTHAATVLEFVAGQHPTTWIGVLKANAELMPGTVQAGLDVDDERALPYPITEVSRAVDEVARLARAYEAREPSEDERHWTSNLADGQCCDWHLLVEPRGHYRRPSRPGSNICQDCVALVLLAEGSKPPMWLLEAEVERGNKPRAWTAALSRWLDDLGMARTA